MDNRFARRIFLAVGMSLYAIVVSHNFSRKVTIVMQCHCERALATEAIPLDLTKRMLQHKLLAMTENPFYVYLIMTRHCKDSSVFVFTPWFDMDGFGVYYTGK